MTESAVVYTSALDEASAARELAEKIAAQLSGPPHALIVFASPRYDHSRLLPALNVACAPAALVGASSAGEFTSDVKGVGMACALALRSDSMRFTAAVGRGVKASRVDVARQISQAFSARAPAGRPYPYRAALVLTDALAGHAEDLVDQLTLETAGKYQFFGGGAGDDANFQRTPVFFGDEAISDACVALEIQSQKPIGIGVGHGWQPASVPLRVTEVRGARVISLNGLPAVQAFQKHAEETQQKLDVGAPIPFFLHNILGLEVGAHYRLRVPLQILEDGSVVCAAEIPEGSLVYIMGSADQSAVEAAAKATAAAMANLNGAKPKVAIFFDCVATRLRLGDVFGFELKAVSDSLGGAKLVGCNTHGQIARAKGQFNGFHNCTAVVCALPE